MQKANTGFHPGLLKIIMDELEYNVPDGTF